ncbi:MAG: hypothetical protein DYG97_02800, partial [Ignavibacteria bacterium CHB3]|nr:hypothetical protein [Ignavibacteria bacterium CHB3]
MLITIRKIEMNRLLLPIFVLTFVVNLYSQNINFEFDYAQFGYDSLSNYVEFYYSFNQVGLTVTNTDTGNY